MNTLFKTRPTILQKESKDCGPTCLQIILAHYGRKVGLERLRMLSNATRAGSSLFSVVSAANKLGFKATAIKLGASQLHSLELPCILHWNHNHFVVLYKIKNKNNIQIIDPAVGYRKLDYKEFVNNWTLDGTNDSDGVALQIIPNDEQQYNSAESISDPKGEGMKIVLKYLSKYRGYIVQLAVGLLAGTLLQLLVPFLTQSIVDVGIKNADVNFIYLILLAQVFVYLGRTGLDLIRGWIVLHLSTRINVSLISDFFIKLMNLPISYFDTKLTGDILQRIGDHKRIEKILTTSSLTTLFSMISFIAFGFVLAYYHLGIFTIFMVGTILYFGWSLYFFKKRKVLDHGRFKEFAREQSKVIELINGMQDIKLNNAEKSMRWHWEKIQLALFNVDTKFLKLEQTQSTGSSFINEMKNILITVLSATLVIEGEITLGMMLAISFIIGQLNAPVLQLIYFFRDVQDAKIALERLAEIHGKPSEKEGGIMDLVKYRADIQFNNVFFKYNASTDYVLKDVNLTIPHGKVTAIVGESGGGKTSLIKLLLRFYEPLSGDIKFDTIPLQEVSLKEWRKFCGVVMQDGYTFNDTIGNNIAIGEESIDQEMLEKSARIANISDFISQLPNGYDTIIGNEGMQLSAGQKQRLMIARVIYRNPKLLVFDEATSFLDSKNERMIVENLDDFFQGKTVLVVAHRLSTVKKADQIVVLDKGTVVEKGRHQELIAAKGHYYELIKNQLEIQ